MKETLLTMTATIAVLGLFIGLLGSIVYFVINPGVFNNFKSVASYFIELLLIGGIIKYFIKRLRKIIEVEKSVSKAITSLLMREPLLHGMIWILIIFQMFAFSYLLPIHYLEISVIDGAETLGMSEISGIKAISEKKNILLDKSSLSKAIYISQRQLAWGDSLRLLIEAKGFKPYSQNLSWPGLVFFNILGGVKVEANLIKLDPLNIYLIVSPSSSQVIIKSAALDTNILGSGNLTIQKNDLIEITISAPNYIRFDTTFVAKNDIELKKQLRKIIRRGTLILMAHTEGGREILEMDVFINGEKMSEKSGHPISLQTGEYIVYMEKLLSEDEKAIVNKFSIKVEPDRESIVKDLIVRIEHP